MPISPAVDLAKIGALTPKGPPASFMPAPQEVLAPQPVDSCEAAALPGQDVPMAYGQKPKSWYVGSPSDIDWTSPLKDQLEPQLSGGPNPKKSHEDFECIAAEFRRWVIMDSKPSFQGKSSPSSALSTRMGPGISSI